MTDIEPAAPSEPYYRPRDRSLSQDERAELLHQVFDRMAQGELTGQALSHYGLSRRRLAQWLRESDTLNREYLQARVLQAAALAEEVVEVAAKPVDNMWSAQQRRTHTDALKWAASKLDPSRWGDKVEIEHTSTKVVRHVMVMPQRQGPPPAIVGGMQSIGEGEVIGLSNRSDQREIEATVTPSVTDHAAAHLTQGDDATQGEP